MLKADGLAAGKGVLILPSAEEAKKRDTRHDTRRKIRSRIGKKVVIEEVPVRNRTVRICHNGRPELQTAAHRQDYKRIGEGDTGLNTGGMGAVSPVPFADDEFMKR